MSRTLFVSVVCFLLVISASAKPITIKLSPKGEADRTAEILAAVEKAHKAGGGVVSLAPGDYWLRSPVESDVWVSNHDNPRPRKIFLPVTGVTNVVLQSKFANGKTRFLADGNGICAAFVDTSGVRVQGIAFDYVRPFYSVWTLKGGKLVGDPKQYPHEIKDGKIFATGNGWREKQTICEIFDPPAKTGEGAGAFRQSVWWDGAADRTFGGHPDGAVAMTRSPYRPNPCVFVYRSETISFDECGAFAAAGMGFLAQRSRDITLTRWHTRGERELALQADATHFSNCAGKIVVLDGVFEGMVDDAINVHSTSLKIVEKKDEYTLVCQYMHHQSVGFEVFLPGERLRFIKGATFEPGAEVKVRSVKMLAKNKVEIRLAAAMPAEYGVEDAVENATWQPNVIFSKNTVRNSTPRATLFTTPGAVVCMNNVFENVAGQPIYFAGDAWDWYESGASRDVIVRDNVFRHCGFKSGRGMIQIEPAVHDLAGQKERYHRNIRIEGNTFEDFKLPLVWARSASDVVLKGNKIINGNENIVIDRDSAEVRKE